MNNRKKYENLTEIIDKSPSEIVDILRNCCSIKWVPKSVDSVDYIKKLDEKDFSLEELSLLRKYMDKFSKICEKRVTLKGDSTKYDSLATYFYHRRIMEESSKKPTN